MASSKDQKEFKVGDNVWHDYAGFCIITEIDGTNIWVTYKERDEFTHSEGFDDAKFFRKLTPLEEELI